MKITLELIYAEIQKLATKEEVAELAMQTDKRFKQVDKMFARQFAHFDKKFKEIDERFDQLATKADIDRLTTQLDTQAGLFSAQEVEITALTSQTRRHENWIQRLVKAVGAYSKL